MTPTDLHTFMTAGHATFTVVGKASRFTYRVSAPKGDRVPESDPRFFVSVLTGPDNTRDYDYAGMLFATSAGLAFRTTKGSKLSADAPSVVAFRWLLERVEAGSFPAALEVHHEGKCGRCGRALTVPASIASGIGPECAKKV